MIHGTWNLEKFEGTLTIHIIDSIALYRSPICIIWWYPFYKVSIFENVLVPLLRDRRRSLNKDDDDKVQNNEHTFDSKTNTVEHSLTTTSNSISLAIWSVFNVAWCGQRDSNSHEPCR